MYEEMDCISLLYTVCGFWGKKWPSAANVESGKTLEPQGEAKRALPGKTPFLNYETVALPLSYIGADRQSERYRRMKSSGKQIPDSKFPASESTALLTSVRGEKCVSK